jgi:hypothetical protein
MQIGALPVQGLPQVAAVHQPVLKQAPHRMRLYRQPRPRDAGRLPLRRPAAPCQINQTPSDSTLATTMPDSKLPSRSRSMTR